MYFLFSLTDNFKAGKHIYRIQLWLISTNNILLVYLTLQPETFTNIQKMIQGVDKAVSLMLTKLKEGEDSILKTQLDQLSIKEEAGILKDQVVFPISMAKNSTRNHPVKI